MADGCRLTGETDALCAVPWVSTSALQVELHCKLNATNEVCRQYLAPKATWFKIAETGLFFKESLFP
jgi:adenine C2-methylase RlmN of 23S rRNA A2503 and tRNA A37